MKTIELKTISYSGKDKINEDYILCHKPSDNSLIAILADGMGGLSYGAEAAKIVSESIMTTILEHVQDSSPEDVLCIAFDVANTAISKKCNELKCRMGAAVTVALIIDDCLYYAWQGNVRVYKVCNGELILLSTDHIVTDVEGSFLTRCVNGKGFRDKVPIKHEKLEQTDRLYICSDGCYQYVDFGKLAGQNFIVSENNMLDDSSLIEINLI